MGCKTIPEILFTFLQGMQNNAKNQGIKMQGMQKLVRDSVRNYAGVAKSCLRFSLNFCQVCNEANRIQFGFLQGVQ